MSNARPRNNAWTPRNIDNRYTYIPAAEKRERHAAKMRAQNKRIIAIREGMKRFWESRRSA